MIRYLRSGALPRVQLLHRADYINGLSGSQKIFRGGMTDTMEERTIILRGSLIDGKGEFAEKATFEICADQITRVELGETYPPIQTVSM